MAQDAMGPQERLACAIARKAHGDAVNPKTGEVYLTHPEHVAAHVEGDAAKAVAWLHDVVEDTDVTLDDLRAAGLSEEVVRGVDAMTHRPGEEYLAFVRRAASDPLARLVKEADVRHNLDLGRIPLPDERDLRRVRDKYLPALRILRESR
jgi:(p)ppGpp synthase/HD superfamily hydrolase